MTPRPRFTPGKGPPVPIVQGAGWAPEPVWTQRLEEKFSAPAGDRTPIARLSKGKLEQVNSVVLPSTNLRKIVQISFLTEAIYDHAL
jgi:hypothetical protein